MSLEQLVQSDIEHFILFTSGHAEERAHTVASLMRKFNLAAMGVRFV